MTRAEADRLARVRLSLLAEPGEWRMTSLVARLGPQQVLQQLQAELDLDGLTRDLHSRDDTDPVRALEQAERLGIRFVVPGDAEWPTMLDGLAHTEPLQGRGGVPLGLWVRGPLPLNELTGAVAIVGSRMATTYGTEHAGRIAATVARSGVPVVSGGAFGIDHAAHRGASAAGGVTVAVLACGVDRHYPVAHRAMLEHLAATSAVVSETPPGGSPMQVRFLARNRLIAGLSAGSVIAEAALRSGALNTANWTDRLGRVLMGLPGPVDSATSEGVHDLIRNGGAALVANGEHVLELIGASGTHLVQPSRGPDRDRDHLTLRQRQVMDAVPVSRPAGADSIARTAGLAPAEVRGILDDLQGHGLVRVEDGGWRLARDGDADIRTRVPPTIAG